MIGNILEELQLFYPEMIEIRRDFHMHPELSFEEVRTPKKVAEFLASWGIPVETAVGGNGVVGRLSGAKPGPTIALRADFDALPIQDEKDTIYKSKTDGVMHACGHDIHTAALLGVANVLSRHGEEIQGTIVFIFQFAEEMGAGGAKPMIRAGCLEGVDFIYGAHVWSPLPIGEASVQTGDSMAAFDGFEINVIGSGGHGALPHETIDPIVTGSRLVMNLQEIVARRIDPLERAVVSVGKFNSGNSGGVIPGIANIGGTVRTFDPLVRREVEKEIHRVVEHACAASGASFEMDYIQGYPSLRIEAEHAATVQRAIERFEPQLTFTEMKPMMTSEDFAYYLQEKPGAFFFVGGGNVELNAVFPHHHAKFDVDERSMLNIGKIFCGILTEHGLIAE